MHSGDMLLGAFRALPWLRLVVKKVCSETLSFRVVPTTVIFYVIAYNFTKLFAEVGYCILYKFMLTKLFKVVAFEKRDIDNIKVN